MTPQVYTTRAPFDTCFSSRAHYLRSSIDSATLAGMIERVMRDIDPTLAAGVTQVEHNPASQLERSMT